MADADRHFWQNKSSDAAVLKAQLKRYAEVADSTLAAFSCSPTVAQYIKLWGMTSAYSSFISLPSKLRVASSELSLKADEVIGLSAEVVDVPMATLFPITATMVSASLPRKSPLSVQLQ